MKILLTGTTGYIGQRLLPTLLENGHEVICCVRDKSRFDLRKYHSKLLKVIEVNFLDTESLAAIPDDIDAAYYLIHSMSVPMKTSKNWSEFLLPILRTVFRKPRPDRSFT